MTSRYVPDYSYSSKFTVEHFESSSLLLVLVFMLKDILQFEPDFWGGQGSLPQYFNLKLYFQGFTFFMVNTVGPSFIFSFSFVKTFEIPLINSSVNPLDVYLIN